MTPLTPQDVITAFSNLSGIRMRIVSHDVEAQAIEFVRHGFTISDLESVIAFTQRQIQDHKSGFSALSLQWKVIFGRRGAGDEWQTWQDRLALATKAVRLRPATKPVPQSRTIDAAGTKLTVLADPRETDPDSIGAETARQLAAFRQSMGGAA